MHEILLNIKYEEISKSSWFSKGFIYDKWFYSINSFTFLI